MKTLMAPPMSVLTQRRPLWVALRPALIVLALALTHGVIAFSQPLQEPTQPLKQAPPSTLTRWQVQGVGGFVWGHSGETAHLAGAHPLGLSFLYEPAGLQLARLDPEAWGGSSARLGWAAGWMASGRPEVLGHWAYLQPTLSHILTRDRGEGIQRSGLWTGYQLGIGLGYTSRVYDRETNPTNIAFSTRVTFSIRGVWQLGLGPRPGEGGWVGVGILHLSNSSMGQPNTGINVPMLVAGATLSHPGRMMRPRPASTFDTLGGVRLSRPRTLSLIQLTAGGKRIEPAPTPVYASVSLMGLKGWVYHRRAMATVAAEAGYYPHLRAERGRALRRPPGAGQGLADTQPMSPEDRHPIAVGLMIGHEFQLGPAVMSLQVGYRIMRPYEGVHPRLYQRYGLRFNPKGRWQPYMGIRTFGGRADAPEFGVGVRL